MGPANSSTANSLLTTIFTDDSEDTYWVTIHKGLEGDQVEVPLTPRMPYAQMEQILLTQMSADPTLSVILSADGQTIDSSAQLIECHQQGSLIFATLVVSVQKMPLPKVVEELQMPESEFRGHRHVLSRYPKGITYKDVANYLYKNKVLLTPSQAHGLFHQLSPKLSQLEEGRARSVCLRAQLIMTLHTFCLEPYAIWEADDGQDECVWYGMAYQGKNLGTDGRFCCPGQRAMQFHEKTPTAASSKHEDVSNLRGVLQARRLNSEKQFLDMLVPPVSHDFMALARPK